MIHRLSLPSTQKDGFCCGCAPVTSALAILDKPSALCLAPPASPASHCDFAAILDRHPTPGSARHLIAKC
jgi:hypothetical protein